MSDITNALIVILTGLIGLATVAVLVSKKANTAGVTKAIFGGFSGALGTAISPITGGGGMNAPSLDIGGNF